MPFMSIPKLNSKIEIKLCLLDFLELGMICNTKKLGTSHLLCFFFRILRILSVIFEYLHLIF